MSGGAQGRDRTEDGGENTMPKCPAEGEATRCIEDALLINRSADPSTAGGPVGDIAGQKKWAGPNNLVGHRREFVRHAHERRIGPGQGLHVRHEGPIHEQLVTHWMHQNGDPGRARDQGAERQQIARDIVDDDIGVAEAGLNNTVPALRCAGCEQPGLKAHARNGLDVEGPEPLRVEDELNPDRRIQLLQSPSLTTFLNRLLALPIALQNGLFEVFESLLAAKIEGAIAAGIYDVGVETVRAENLAVVARRTLYTHPASGAETQLFTVRRRDRSRPVALAEALDLAADPGAPARLLVNAQSGRAAVQAPAPSLMLDDGEVERRVRLIRPVDRLTLSEPALTRSQWREAG